jgi:hypothetical protein
MRFGEGRSEGQQVSCGPLRSRADAIAVPGAPHSSVKNRGFRNFYGTIFAETNQVHQVTKVQRDLPYKPLIKGRNDISK